MKGTVINTLTHGSNWSVRKIAIKHIEIGMVKDNIDKLINLSQINSKVTNKVKTKKARAINPCIHNSIFRLNKFMSFEKNSHKRIAGTAIAKKANKGVIHDLDHDLIIGELFFFIS